MCSSQSKASVNILIRQLTLLSHRNSPAVLKRRTRICSWSSITARHLSHQRCKHIQNCKILYQKLVDKISDQDCASSESPSTWGLILLTINRAATCIKLISGITVMLQLNLVKASIADNWRCDQSDYNCSTYDVGVYCQQGKGAWRQEVNHRQNLMSTPAYRAAQRSQLR